MRFADVIRQVADAMAGDKTVVNVAGKQVPVTYTGNLGLKKIEFSSQDGRQFIALEQNPNKNSSWAEQARAGHNVVQILEKTGNGNDRYVAVAVDQTVTFYESRS